MVVLGDSFTFGSFDRPPAHALCDSEIFPALLEQALPGTSVINLGVDGYSLGQQLLYLREEGFQYQPDLIILSPFEGDLIRSTLKFRDSAKPYFELRDNRLALRGVPVPPPEAVAQFLQSSPPLSYIGALVRFTIRSYHYRNTPLGELELDQVNEAILDAVRREAEEHGAKLLVVIIPRKEYRWETRRGERLLEDWCRRAGVPRLALRDVFLRLPIETQQKLYLHHWTSLGHEVVAKAILEKIIAEGLLPKMEKGGVPSLW